MNTVKIDKRNAKLVGHMGLAGLETENTCAAFVAAGNRTYYGIETDIHRTSDGKFAVIHDFDLKRVGGEDIKVEDTPLSVLQSVVLFDKNKEKDRVDLRIPSLENYIGICKKYQKHCVLELKSVFTEEEIEKIIAIIKDFDYLDSVTFISFSYQNLEIIREILPNQSVQFLFSEVTEEIITKVVRDKMDVDVYYKALNGEIINRLKAEGLKINCWTVDNKETAENLISLGVDYVTTNILE